MNSALPRDIADVDDPAILLRRTEHRIEQVERRLADLSTVRNRATVALNAAGRSYRDLATSRGLSPAGIGHIVTSAGREVLEVFRAWHAVTLELQGLVSGIDRSITLATRLGIEADLLTQIGELRADYSRYLHTDDKPTHDEANDFADTAIVVNAKLVLWTRAQRGKSVTALLPGDERSHQAWRISGSSELATACSLTGVPVKVEPDHGWLCPECNDATR